MNKPYITLKAFIVEVAGWMFTIAALIYSIVYDTTLVVLSISMIVTLAIVSLVLHLLPPSSWNMPVKITERNALICYTDVANMLALLILWCGIYTFIMVVFVKYGDTVTWAASAFLLVTTLGTIIYEIEMTKRHSKM